MSADTLWEKECEPRKWLPDRLPGAGLVPDRVTLKSKEMDPMFGPFGGGWRTKFGLLVGSKRHVLYWWRWQVTIRFEAEQ